MTTNAVHERFTLDEYVEPFIRTSDDLILSSDQSLAGWNPFRSGVRFYSAQSGRLIRELDDVGLVQGYEISSSAYAKAAKGKNFYEISTDPEDLQTPKPAHPVRSFGRNDIALFVDKRGESMQVHRLQKSGSVESFDSCESTVLYVDDDHILTWNNDKKSIENLVTSQQIEVAGLTSYERATSVHYFGNRQFALTNQHRVVDLINQDTVAHYESPISAVVEFDGLVALSVRDSLKFPFGEYASMELPLWPKYFIVQHPTSTKQDQYQSAYFPFSVLTTGKRVWNMHSSRESTRIVAVGTDGVYDVNAKKFRRTDKEPYIIQVNGEPFEQQNEHFLDPTTAEQQFSIPKPYNPSVYGFIGNRLLFQSPREQQKFVHCAILVDQ